MERIPINLCSALNLTIEEIKMYEKLLNACMSHSAPVQGPDSALGALEERMLEWGCQQFHGLLVLGHISSSPNVSLQLCMFSTCVTIVLYSPIQYGLAKSGRIKQGYTQKSKS